MGYFWGTLAIVAVIIGICITIGYFQQRGRDILRARAVADELEKRKSNGTL